MRVKQLRKTLDKHRVSCSCHELHGLLCGMLAVNISTEFGKWTEEMCNFGMDPDCFRGTSATVWRSLFDDTVTQLGDGDLHFRPLLHEDPMGDYGVRMHALTDWCSGFMYGVGVSGADFEKNLSADGRKFLADVSEISSADCTTLSGDGQKKNEVAYDGVVEYLGVGVVMMCDEVVSRKDRKRLH